MTSSAGPVEQPPDQTHRRRAEARTILRLALPALGALTAEPLYLLVDTAIVGHLGTTPLAGLALGALVVGGLLGLATFLEYGSTGAIARSLGAGRRADALDIAGNATLLAAGVGVALLLVIEAGGDLSVRLLGGGDAAVHEQALSWLRIAALGAPFVCVTLTGQAWLRGFQRNGIAFLVVLGGNLASAGLSAALVYGAGMGIRGSAVANAVAQVGSAVVFTLMLRRQGAAIRLRWAVLRGQLTVARDLSARTLGFLAAYAVSTGVAAHLGAAVVAAHQVGDQVWQFLALGLDSLAIAAQSLVGEHIGGGRIEDARALGWRVTRWGAAAGAVLALLLLAGYDVIPRWFTSDAAVIDQAHRLWPLLALMQPATGATFALDGVLIGAGDTGFLARTILVSALGVYVPAALLSGAAGVGITGIWVGLTGFIVLRLALCLLRLRGDRWWVAGRREIMAGTRPT